MRGGMRRPSLAIAWYMPAICSTVIDKPWPMGRLANVLPDHWSWGGTRPALSPGSPTLVRWPRPIRLSMSTKRSAPTRCAVSSVPMLDESANTPVNVRFTVPCDHASRTVRSATRSSPGTGSTVSGVTTPLSIPAAAVTTLLTEPGSKGAETAGFPNDSGVAAARLFGSKVTSLAIA
jgi:hypothetical protein